MQYDCDSLKKIRENARLTQEQLAVKLGVYTTTYARWEHNPLTIKLADLLIIAEFYNVSLDYLTGHTNAKAVNK